jgi:hypothetical protein
MKFILRTIILVIVIVVFYNKIAELAINIPTQSLAALSKHTPNSSSKIVNPRNQAPTLTNLVIGQINGQPITNNSPEMRTQIQQQQFAEEMEKNAKYKAYYHKPERCDPPSTHEIRVACVNENMRAKAKFEELYQQGKL